MAFKIEVICTAGPDDSQYKDRCYELRTYSDNGYNSQFVLVGNDTIEENWIEELEVRDGQFVFPDHDDFDDDGYYTITKVVEAKLTYSEVGANVAMMFE